MNLEAAERTVQAFGTSTDLGAEPRTASKRSSAEHRGGRHRWRAFLYSLSGNGGRCLMVALVAQDVCKREHQFGEGTVLARAHDRVHQHLAF